MIVVFFVWVREWPFNTGRRGVRKIWSATLTKMTTAYAHVKDSNPHHIKNSNSTPTPGAYFIYILYPYSIAFYNIY